MKSKTLLLTVMLSLATLTGCTAPLPEVKVNTVKLPPLPQNMKEIEPTAILETQKNFKNFIENN